MWNELAVSIALALFGLFGATLLRKRDLQTEGRTRFVLCSTSHTRLFPVRHSFKYSLLYVFISLDEPESNPFCAIDKWRIFRIRNADYLGSPPCGKRLLEKLHWHLKQHVLYIQVALT